MFDDFLHRVGLAIIKFQFLFILSFRQHDPLFISME